MKKDVVCLNLRDTVQVAAIRMRDANIGFLPVIEASGKVLGTLTDRDIAIRLVAEDRSASSCAVEEVMSREVVACRPTDELGHAEVLMAEHKKSRMLITNEDGYLEGVLSLSDVARMEGARRTASTMRQVTSREGRL
jgi:CBS domain-containing protein